MRRHWLTTAALLGALVLLGFWTSKLNDARTQQGEQAHAALCIFRDGLGSDIQRNARKLREGQQFIDKHPRGAFGYTQAQLRSLHAKDAADLTAQRTRFSALAPPNLTCP